MKRAYKVKFEVVATYSNDFEEEIEIESDKKLSDNEVEQKIFEELQNLDYDTSDLCKQDEDITITEFEEIPTLEPMNSKECLRCEIYKNFCKKCIYFKRNKCKGNF